MSIFAIGDLHLSFGETIEKPMDIFGSAWENHAERLRSAWETQVKEEDTVILCGDISWGLRLPEAMADLEWIHALPGRKVLFRGNHDLWWQSIGKLNKLYDDGSMFFVQNQCALIREIQEDGSTRCTAVCGTRGWNCPGAEGFTEHDQKIYDRELLRLELSLEAGVASGAERLIAALHYPPTNDKQQASGFTDLLCRYGVSTCVYGHLHGKESFSHGLTGIFNGVEYHLVSLDYIDGIPLRLTC